MSEKPAVCQRCVEKDAAYRAIRKAAINLALAGRKEKEDRMADLNDAIDQAASAFVPSETA